MRRLATKYKFPENLLKSEYQYLSKTEVRSLLKKLLGAENRAHPTAKSKWLKPYFLRLKWKRLKVVAHYEKIGGEVSVIAKRRRLPWHRDWPGTIFLLKATKRNET
ncbi:hypothetical protein LMJ53_16900 [Rheinheimera sp. UJ51]|uniref:hypothetical protein n=1 Tax=Rheinheimera sp. UJ51 TaxID=2892446 RepID=UPI001E354AA8|nr:hypothetical protein [Rheinheimera sp. UJ51]MCC5453396.1 hypothetical protein [Rheinheimera sp. UJ51]